MTVFSCFSLVFKGQTIFGFVIPECQRFIRKESGSLTHVTNNATHYGTRLSLVPSSTTEAKTTTTTAGGYARRGVLAAAAAMALLAAGSSACVRCRDGGI